MKADEIFNQAELVTTHHAARIAGKHVNSIRRSVSEGKVLSRKLGRDYWVPVVYDDDGAAYFLYRVAEGNEES